MAICPYNANIRCGVVGECENCVHRAEVTVDDDDYYGSEYDEETRDALRIDYDETDPY